MKFFRVVLFALMLLLAVSLSGCGKNSVREGAKAHKKADTAFSLEMIPVGATSIVLRTDRLGGARDNLVRVPLFRLADSSISEVPSWLGREFGWARTPAGDVVWFLVKDRHAAKRYLSKHGFRVFKGQGKWLVAADSSAALDAYDREPRLDNDPRAERYESVLKDRSTLVYASSVTPDVSGFVGVNARGVWVDAHTAGKVACAKSDNAMGVLGDLSPDSYLAASSLKWSARMLNHLLGFEGLMQPRVSASAQGVVKQLFGVARETSYLLSDTNKRSALGIALSDTGRPVAAPVSSNTALRLKNDEQFRSLVEALPKGERSAVAMWLNPDLLFRDFGGVYLKGAKGAIFSGLADGVDGVLVWQCGNQFKALIQVD